MQQRKQARIDRVSQHIALLPVREDLIALEFERFRSTGELPEQQRLAAEVVQRALRGEPRPPEPALSQRELCARLIELLDAHEEDAEQPDSPQHPPLREILFHEAVHGDEFEREAARLALQWEVRRGGDVASEEFLADRSLPDHGSLGMHLLGFPQCLARAPYVRQAKRLFARYDQIRKRIDYSNPDWFAPIAVALPLFRRSGKLPEDDLVRECVLSDTEMIALIQHYSGDGDAEVLAAFDAAARAKDDSSRFIALDNLMDLAWEGRLIPRLKYFAVPDVSTDPAQHRIR